jgi:drug/metabolite transporter (DMT)-like permease
MEAHMPLSKRIDNRVRVFIFMSALIFATMEVALKVAGSALDPFQATFLRFAGGGLTLLPNGIWELRANNVRLTARTLAYILLLGVVCVPVSMTLFQIGVMNLNASTAAVLFCSNPAFTMLFAHFLNENDKMNRVKAGALALALAGALMMVRPWDIQPGNTLAGAAQTLASALTFSLYTALSARTLNKVGAFAQTSLAFILGSLAMIPPLAAAGRPVFTAAAEDIPLLLYISVIVTGGGYLLYFLAIKHSNATTGSIIFFLKPVMAPMIAAAALSEPVTWNMCAGVAFTLAASYLLIRNKSRRRP